MQAVVGVRQFGIGAYFACISEVTFAHVNCTNFNTI